jgi:hypothetical protein
LVGSIGHDHDTPVLYARHNPAKRPAANIGSMLAGRLSEHDSTWQAMTVSKTPRQPKMLVLP